MGMVAYATGEHYAVAFGCALESGVAERLRFRVQNHQYTYYDVVPVVAVGDVLDVVARGSRACRSEAQPHVRR